MNLKREVYRNRPLLRKQGGKDTIASIAIKSKETRWKVCMHLPAIANLSVANAYSYHHSWHGYNTNLSKIYSTLSLLWQDNKWGIEAKVGIKCCMDLK